MLNQTYQMSYLYRGSAQYFKETCPFCEHTLIASYPARAFNCVRYNLVRNKLCFFLSNKTCLRMNI